MTPVHVRKQDLMTAPNAGAWTPDMLRLLRHSVQCPLVKDIVQIDMNPDTITACEECVEIKKVLTKAGFPRG
jgi:predicted nucleic acid-binding Zn ribbon protein